MRSSYARMVGTKVGPIIAAIIIAHMANRLNSWLGIIDIGALAMLNMTHQAQRTTAKKPRVRIHNQ